MKKTKIIFWVAGLIFLSGWIAFFIQYIHSTKQIALLQTRIEQLDSQMKTIGSISKNIDQIVSEIDKMLGEFESLKEKLLQTRDRIEKASKTE